MASAHEDLTRDDVIDEWREEHAAPEMPEDDLEAIQAALDDVDAGVKGRPFEEFDAEMRREFNFPPRT